MLAPVHPNPAAETLHWIRLKNSEPDALGYFYDAYVDQLFIAALKMTGKRELAKDAIQEVFLQLWKYRKSPGDIKNTRAYLFKVLRNIILSNIRKMEQVSDIFSDDLLSSGDETIEDQLISMDTRQENKSKLTRALAHLTKRQKTILQLHFYEGLSYQQIAEKLCMNRQSVNNLAFRTMLKLRSEMYGLLGFGYIIIV